MQFIDAATVEGKPRRTADGYLIATAKSVRTGVQLYAGSEVGMADKAMVRVYRPPEEVFADASLQSFSHAPVTNDHPAEAVTTDNWKDLAVGEVSTAAKKDGDWVHLPLILKDAAAINAVENGKRELSAGYTCTLDWTPGTTPKGEAYDAVQRSIKINHLALVDRARAGSEARIGDGAYSWGAAPILPTTDKEPRTMSDALRTVVVDGLSVSTTDQGAQAIDKLTKERDSARQATTDAATAHTAAIAAKDAELAKKDAEIDTLKGKIVDGAVLDKLVADRAALCAVAAKIAPTVKLDGLADADIRKAVVTTKLGDAAVKDKSADYINARFDILAEDAGKTVDPFRKVVADGITPTNDADASGAAYKAMADGLTSAWQNPTGKVA